MYQLLILTQVLISTQDLPGTYMYIPIRPYKNKCKTYFPTTSGFRMNISMKLFFKYVAIFFNFASTVSYFHPLEIENYSRLVVDKDDNRKVRLERVKYNICKCLQILMSKHLILHKSDLIGY